MKRQVEQLTNQTFDVLVIGGGIHGAAAAWDAALRGLSVALIERGDFGGATSQNSLKIIHGGLRYLQDGNLPRIRKMAYERTTWMKIAPHLIHPLTCLTPTRKKLARSRLAMRVALTLNDLLSFDRNRLPDAEKHLSGGRVISARECAELLPGYDASTSTGAAVWHDAQIFNSERLVLALILSAAHTGAQVANYVEAVGFLKSGAQVTGVKAVDRLTGENLDIQARVVINASGAWVDNLLEKVASHSQTAASVAMNLIVDKVWSGAAAALPSQPGPGKRSQVLLIVPWRSQSMIGTWHVPWNKPPDEFRLDLQTVQNFIDEINTAHPQLGLTMRDVKNVAWGFLPVSQENAGSPRVRLMRDDQLIDHQIRDGIAGLISVVSVKYTTARVTAEQVVNLACAKLPAKPSTRCKTSETPIQGGQIEDFGAFLQAAKAKTPAWLNPEVMEHLAYTYGSDYPVILRYLDMQPQWAEQIDPQSPVITAEVIHAIRHEMAQTLSDIIQRRTELGAACPPTRAVLQKCAEIAACELGWSVEQQQQEISAAEKAYPIHQLASTVV